MKTFGILRRIFGVFGWLISAIVFFFLLYDRYDITPGYVGCNMFISFLYGFLVWIAGIVLYCIGSKIPDIFKWIVNGDSK